jgi:hypothetical protein
MWYNEDLLQAGAPLFPTGWTRRVDLGRYAQTATRIAQINPASRQVVYAWGWGTASILLWRGIAVQLNTAPRWSAPTRRR